MAESGYSKFALDNRPKQTRQRRKKTSAPGASKPVTTGKGATRRPRPVSSLAGAAASDSVSPNTSFSSGASSSIGPDRPARRKFGGTNGYYDNWMHRPYDRRSPSSTEGATPKTPESTSSLPAVSSPSHRRNAISAGHCLSSTDLSLGSSLSPHTIDRRSVSPGQTRQNEMFDFMLPPIPFDKPTEGYYLSVGSDNSGLAFNSMMTYNDPNAYQVHSSHSPNTLSYPVSADLDLFATSSSSLSSSNPLYGAWNYGQALDPTQPVLVGQPQAGSCFSTPSHGTNPYNTYSSLHVHPELDPIPDLHTPENFPWPSEPSAPNHGPTVNGGVWYNSYPIETPLHNTFDVAHHHELGFALPNT